MMLKIRFTLYIILGFQVRTSNCSVHNYKYGHLDIYKTDQGNAIIIDSVSKARSITECAFLCDELDSKSVYFRLNNLSGTCYCNNDLDYLAESNSAVSVGNSLYYAALTSVVDVTRYATSTPVSQPVTSSLVSSVVQAMISSTKGSTTQATSTLPSSTPDIDIISDCSTYADSSNSDINEVRAMMVMGLHGLVYCENGWTVFQKRKDGTVSFLQNWTQYENGFGDVYGEYWLGLKYIHLLTKDRMCGLKVQLKTSSESHTVLYRSFSVSGPADGYRLSVDDYSTGSNLTDSLIYHNGLKFSTFDSDNDECPSCNCADMYNGGWWYYSCAHSNLNGLYFQNETHNPYMEGIVWLDHVRFFNSEFSFRFSQMSLSCIPV